MGTVLVAQTASGERVEATRELPADAYSCPLCSGMVILKRGRVVVAHFAHEPGAICDQAGESLSHHLAKRVLADGFREVGYTVELEEPHMEFGRRIDVAVTLPTGHRVAIEVQDSAISIDEMKSRCRADHRAGFFGTLWVFTSKRAARILGAGENSEVRIPEEVRWVHDRFGQGVFILDEKARRMWRCHFGTIVRPGGETEDETFPDRTLRSTKTVARAEVGFALTARRTKYHKPTSPDFAVVFVSQVLGKPSQ